MLDGAEFEEMLVIVPQGRQHRNLTLWRTQTAVFAQLPQGRPRAFATMKDALESLRPAQTRAGWKRLLRLPEY